MLEKQIEQLEHAKARVCGALGVSPRVAAAAVCDAALAKEKTRRKSTGGSAAAAAKELKTHLVLNMRVPEPSPSVEAKC